MDFFQHRYYRTVKILMSVIGQWPEQTTRSRWGFLAIFLLLSGSVYVAVTMAMIEYHDDWEILLDCVSALVGGVFCYTKLMIFVWNPDKMSELLNRIRADWLEWAEYREVNFLHEYADEAGKCATWYAVGMYSLISLFVVQPIVPKLIDVVLKNGSEPGLFPIPVHYYHLDEQKYYFYLIVHIYVSVSALLTLYVTNDVMLIVYVRHGCGIFAALGHKLELIGKNIKIGDAQETAYVFEQRNRTLEYQIIWCIARHNDAMKYAKLIEATYTWSFLVTMIFRITIYNIIALQIITRKNEPQETLRFVAIGACLMVYVYVESYFAHVLTDHSINIRYYIQKGQWYYLSTKVQKLLLMMMMRCNAPCRLTAGKLFNMSIETFTAFLKTSMSYLTVLRSI